MEKAMIPKMKRIDKKHRKLHIPVLNFILVFSCVFLLIVATFFEFNISHIIAPFNKSLATYNYALIPQIPALMFVVGLMGRKLGMTSVILYILLGLFYVPIFAFGGGLSYFGQYGFGYILAYLPAVFLAGTILQEEFSLINILKATILCVLLIHFVGILYMFIISLLRHENWIFMKHWIYIQSFAKIAYDMIASFIALFLAKFANKYVNYLIG